jgi:hypothetical protein
MMLRRIVVDYRVAWVSTVVVASVIVSGGVAERQKSVIAARRP